MARIRSVKPELRESILVASWPFPIRYFWVLLWGYLDDSGRGLDLSKRIAGDCFPHDDITAEDIDKWLDMMGLGIDGDEGPVCRYQVNGARYIHSVNWSEHQKPNRPTPSRLPQCPLHESLTEPLNGNSLPGAAEQQSRGAEEQQQTPRESLTADRPDALIDTNTFRATTGAARLIVDATACTPEQAQDAVIAIAKARNPHNLTGLVRTLIAAGEIGQWLDKSHPPTRTRDGPPCPHGTPGGAEPLPGRKLPSCPLCRRDHRKGS